MTDVPALIDAFERALDAQAAALSSPDPAALERSNQELAALVATLAAERRRRACQPAAVAVLLQLQSRISAHGAILARAASGNRAALTVLGLAGQGDIAAVPMGQRRATHLLA